MGRNKRSKGAEAMQELTKGVITYNQEIPPQSLSQKQIRMAEEIAKEIINLGCNVLIKYDSGTIDIVIKIDSSNSGLNIGIFRVFWDWKGDNKIQYLGVGIGYCDGYEIKRGWSNNLEINEVANTLKKDIEYYNNKTKKRL
jgi:hypothetical protein